MVGAALIAVLAGVAPAEPGQDRGAVEVRVATEVLYPPGIKEPRRHIAYGVAGLASLRAGSRFKAMVGASVDHVVDGWLGKPELAAPRKGPWAGTLPSTFRGHLVRGSAVARFGIENHFAYGYLGVAPGYALRTAALACTVGTCGHTRTTEHGLNLGANIGALINPESWYGVVVGAEVGLDWAWFPRRHPLLAPWNQGMHARLVLGYAF